MLIVVIGKQFQEILSHFVVSLLSQKEKFLSVRSASERDELWSKRKTPSDFKKEEKNKI